MAVGKVTHYRRNAPSGRPLLRQAIAVLAVCATIVIAINLASRALDDKAKGKMGANEILSPFDTSHAPPPLARPANVVVRPEALAVPQKLPDADEESNHRRHRHSRRHRTTAYAAEVNN